MPNHNVPKCKSAGYILLPMLKHFYRQGNFVSYLAEAFIAMVSTAVI